MPFDSLAVLQRIQAEAEVAIRQGGAAPLQFRQEQLVGNGDTGQPADRPVHPAAGNEADIPAESTDDGVKSARSWQTSESELEAGTSQHGERGAAGRQREGIGRGHPARDRIQQQPFCNEASAPPQTVGASAHDDATGEPEQQCAPTPSGRRMVVQMRALTCSPIGYMWPYYGPSMFVAVSAGSLCYLTKHVQL